MEKERSLKLTARILTRIPVKIPAKIASIVPKSALGDNHFAFKTNREGLKKRRGKSKFNQEQMLPRILNQMLPRIRSQMLLRMLLRILALRTLIRKLSVCGSKLESKKIQATNRTEDRTKNRTKDRTKDRTQNQTKETIH